MALTVTLIYGITICAIFVALLLLRLVSILENHTLFLLLRNVYPFLYRRFLFLAYVSLTIFCNVRGVHNASQASIRAGWLSVTNLIPLFVSGRMAMVVNALGLSLRDVFAVHTATGFMAVAQAMTHIFLELRNSGFRLDSSVPFYGFLVILLAGIVMTPCKATLNDELTNVRLQ